MPNGKQRAFFIYMQSSAVLPCPNMLPHQSRFESN